MRMHLPTSLVDLPKAFWVAFRNWSLLAMSLGWGFPRSEVYCLGQSSCTVKGDMDVFVLLDVSPSVMAKKEFVPTCIRFIESKVSELSSGKINIVTFAQDWVQTHPDYPANFETQLVPGDSRSRVAILRYLDPHNPKPVRDGGWSGLFDAAARKAAIGTDIGKASSRALDALERRLDQPGYLDHTIGQQLWVLTDSEEEGKTYPLAQVLSRMRALQGRIWFQYHEIAFVSPAKIQQRVRIRHDEIVNAGFFVDYSSDLARSVRVPAPWSGFEGRPPVITGELDVPCDYADRGIDIPIEPAIVFETCGDQGERVPGVFELRLLAGSASRSAQAAKLSSLIAVDNFGKPIKSIHLNLPSGLFASNSVVELPYSLNYNFRPTESTNLGKLRVSYLAPTDAKVRLRLKRRPAPIINVSTVGLAQPSATVGGRAGNRFGTSVAPAFVVLRSEISPGDQLSTFELRGTNLTSEITLEAAIQSTPPHAVLFSGGASSLTAKLGPGHESQQITVFAAETDACESQATLTLAEISPGPCPVIIQDAPIVIEAQYARPIIEVAGLEPQIEPAKIQTSELHRIGVEPGGLVGTLEVRASKLRAEVHLDALLESIPPHSLGMDDGQSTAVVKLGPGHESQIIRVFGLGTDLCDAQGTFKLSWTCGASAQIVSVPIQVQFLENGELRWFSASKVAMNRAPESIRLRALQGDSAGSWAFQFRKDEKDAAGPEFALILSHCLEGKGGCRLTLEPIDQNNDLRKAITMKWADGVEALTGNSFVIRNAGTNYLRFELQPRAGARLYKGLLRCTPMAQFGLNGQAELVIPITVDLAGVKDQ